jgi:hypothetical protein
MFKNVIIFATAVVVLAPLGALAAGTDINRAPSQHSAAPTLVQNGRASTGNFQDAPGGVGPGFTNPEDFPQGLVAPGAIGRNGIEAPDNIRTR